MFTPRYQFVFLYFYNSTEPHCVLMDVCYSSVFVQRSDECKSIHSTGNVCARPLAYMSTCICICVCVCVCLCMFFIMRYGGFALVMLFSRADCFELLDAFSCGLCLSVCLCVQLCLHMCMFACLQLCISTCACTYGYAHVCVCASCGIV